MKVHEKINGRQFALLAAYIAIGDSMLVLPSVPIFEAKQNGWMSALIGIAAGLLIVQLLSVVGKLYPRLTLAEYQEKLFGKWLGKAVTLCFLIYLFISAAAHVREIGDFMTTQMMPETPIHAIHIMYVGIMVIGVRLGLEAIARLGEFFFPWFILFFSLFIMFLLPEINVNHLLPLWEGGVKSILRGSITMTAYPFMELVVLLMLFPYVNKAEVIRANFMKGALFGGVVLLIIVFLAILVLGPEFAGRNFYPSYALAKKIDIGRFLQRIEVILAFMWLLTSFVKSAVFFYVFHIAFAQVFGLRHYKGLILPFGMLLVSFALLISPSIIYFHDSEQYWPYMDLSFGVFLPVALLGAYAVRRGLARNKDKEDSG